MPATTRLILSTFILIGVSALAVASDDAVTARPLVGEVRALAIAPGNTKAVSELHRDGWLETRGQQLSSRDFPELYETIGRAWTSEGVPEDRFAVPDYHDRSQRRISSDNPFGVLGPGDLVTSGRARNESARQAPLSYWIFVGRDLSGVNVNAAVRR
jgi:DNA-binding response OmpR family regulator